LASSEGNSEGGRLKNDVDEGQREKGGVEEEEEA